ncbi:MAG: glutamate synthase large subunit [Acidimicrobiia bacterium]
MGDRRNRAGMAASIHDPVERDACGIGFVADSSGRSSRALLDAVLGGLAGVKHRGALAADSRSSDGAGVLLPLDRAFLSRVAAQARVAVPRPDEAALGTAMCFLDRDADAAAAARAHVEAAATESGLDVHGWRDVPVDLDRLGAHALAIMPAITQMIFSAPGADDPEAEGRSYLARRRAEKAAAAGGVPLYVASCSTRTVTYKALVPGDDLAAFYPDLAAPDHEVAFGIFHMRFSTNTAPSWERAQPFRFLCHNGEINTIEGNRNRMRQRVTLGAQAPIDDEAAIRPVLDLGDSDSGNLDAAVEVLVRGGRGLTHAVAMVIPDAWEAVLDMPPPVRDFYAYHACLSEPWDGPAAVIVTDGRRVAAALDRNGLRPLRFHVCEDGFVAACSEAGAIDVSGHGKVKRGRLGPGQMLCLDPDAGGFADDGACKAKLAASAPYGAWVEDGLQSWGPGELVDDTRDDLERRRVAFGWTAEELAMVVKPMATDAKEPTFSMGDDTPAPVLGTKRRPLHHSFKQRFAQVTNPPIDHLRERLVMSLRTLVGPRAALLSETAEAAHLLEFRSFLVRPSVLERLTSDQAPLQAAVLDATFESADGQRALQDACTRLARDAEAAVGAGARVLVVRDTEISAGRAPVPVLLAAGAVHHGLFRARLRSRAAIVVDSDEVRDTHHCATLLGYGADLVCPRLLLETVAAFADDDQLGSENTSAVAQEKVQAALEDGVLKIMSKMGISCLESYRGSQLFEAIGLDAGVVEACFAGTASSLGGLTWGQLGAEVLERHDEAWGTESPRVTGPGIFRHRKGGEYHANNPEVIEALHLALGLDTDRTAKRGGAGGGPRAVPADTAELYGVFARLVDDRPPTEPHDLLEIAVVDEPIPVAEVEPAEAILRRFVTGAMSHGAISREAHADLAAGMNMVGGKSNSGEGGEARSRFETRGHDRDENCRIKQVASGRFGVTPEYCAHADELQIKMAQGSKPGEGGQIPGHKVTEEIAELRKTQPGVTLISPPPHHDIYSIEDLAQLVFDLKQVNAAADVSVKLVAIKGVGTIAAGVAKALAESVYISGCTGGTGASPLSSIKHAGMPWSLGLAETHQALVANDLRGRIRIGVDGGFKTGRDVIVAALLGADEYGFGTAALLAQGCIMVRACHRDTCPTGIATQRPHLRAKYQGSPESVATYMRHVAQEVRGYLAALGFRTMDEAIGRVDRLFQRVTGDDRLDSLDLSPLLATPVDGIRHYGGGVPEQRVRSSLGDRVVIDAFRALWDGDDLELHYPIGNEDRTVGAALGGSVALEFGAARPPGYVTVHFDGTAGQSFGAFLTEGIDFRLTGEANDYVCKAMGGGRVVIKAPPDDAGDPVLAGNTILYGATGGELFLAGRAGERFAVRNSGAVAVVEGVGQHACEYMTGGTVVVLGGVGFNMCAGMTGGEVFVHDASGGLTAKVNTALVRIARPDGGDLERCRVLVERHEWLTGSPRARILLEDWAEASQRFWRVAPVGVVQRFEATHAEPVGTGN